MPSSVRVIKMENQTWKEDIQNKLDERGIIAIESSGILTSKDVLTAIGIIDKLEADRDEATEWEHIKELQKSKAERLVGSNYN